MTSIVNGEAGSSVRTKLNAQFTKTDFLTVTGAVNLDEVVRGAETYENATGSTIAALKAVYVSGYGTHPQISLADADNASNLPAIGITTASIANGASGSVQVDGVLTGVDTSGFAQNALLYVSGTAGDLTATEPTSGHSQPIALVERSHASLGELRLNPQRPLKIGDPLPVIEIALSDETTALTTGTAKATVRAPYAFTLTGVRAWVTTAPTGAALTVDINEGGTTVLSTKLTIDATEKTSTTAATAAVISDAAIADDAEITFDIDTVGSTVAGAGLKVRMYGTAT